MENNEIKTDERSIASQGERIVAAIYMVSGLMDPNEPLNNSIRKSGTNLISSISRLAQVSHRDVAGDIRMSLISVTELLSFFNIAKVSRLLTEMNTTMILKALRNLQVALESKQPFLTTDSLFTETFTAASEMRSSRITSSFDTVTPLTKVISDDQAKQPKVQRNRHIQPSPIVKDTQSQPLEVSDTQVHIKDKSPEVEVTQRDHSVYLQANPSSSVTIDQSQPPTAYQPLRPKLEDGRKFERRTQVLSVFSPGVELGIKDITKVVKGCSEKTIQRELTSLVESNTVERIGEKRWAKYRLVSS